MKPGHGKNKGTAFERDICKKLSLWVTSGERSDVFWRSAISGGRATVHNKDGEVNVRQGGDICSVSPEGYHLMDHFYFELKHYADLELAKFFVKGTGVLANFWIHTVEEAKIFNKKPVMVVKQNRMPVLVLALSSEFIACYHSFCSCISFQCFVSHLEDVLGKPYPVGVFDEEVDS